MVASKLWQILGLVALVAVVSVSGQATVTVQLFAGTGCSGTQSMAGSYANGTVCYALGSGFYADFSCDSNGTPSGQTCYNSCPGNCQPASGTTETWGVAMCGDLPDASISVTCTQPSPDAASPDAATSPTAPTAPAPTAVVSPDVEPPAWSFPNDLVGSGSVSIQPYLANNCASPYGSALDLTANINLCQRKTITGYGDLYLRADCFASNSSSYAWFCGSDTTCSNCQPFASTPSGQCLNYQISLLRSVMFTCPSNAPSAAPAAPATPTPSGDASSLSFVYATFFIILGVAYLLL